MQSARDYTKVYMDSSYSILFWKKLMRAIIEAQLKHHMIFAYLLRTDPFEPMQHILMVDTFLPDGQRYRHMIRALANEKLKEDDQEAAALKFFTDAMPLLVEHVEEVCRG